MLHEGRRRRERMVTEVGSGEEEGIEAAMLGEGEVGSALRRLWGTGGEERGHRPGLMGVAMDVAEAGDHTKTAAWS